MELCRRTVSRTPSRSSRSCRHLPREEVCRPLHLGKRSLSNQACDMRAVSSAWRRDSGRTTLAARNGRGAYAPRTLDLAYRAGPKIEHIEAPAGNGERSSALRAESPAGLQESSAKRALHQSNSTLSSDIRSLWSLQGCKYEPQRDELRRRQMANKSPMSSSPPQEGQLAFAPCGR